jgi:LuxR family maltose regulon positive regulatory protein
MDAKQDIILLSKLEAPQIKTKLLYRKRLVDLLSENLDKNVVLICAGAGYGKTTLLSQFLSNRNIPYVYYHLEKSDAEPVVFFSYLIAGIRRVVPEFGRKTETLSHFFNYPQRYLELIVGTFINEIIQVIKQDLYIILEDYHALYSTENINRILNYLLDHLPPKLHLIITSRMAPPLTLSQLRARDEIFELGGQDLKFTKEEIKNLFNTVYSISLKESELEWIEEHLEGWPTSLRLMLQSFHYPEKKRSPGYIKRILDSYYQSQNNLFNYFAQEIYNQESKSTRHFLVECSIFEWLTPGLCGSVTRRKDSAELLAALTTRNAFLLRMPGMGYRFHNLFRDFLYSKLTDTSRENRLYARAAGFYIKEGRLEDALKFYLQAEEYKKAASIIEKIGTGLIGQGRSGILSSYIEQIPKSVKVKRPSLLMNYAQSLIYSGRTDEAKNHCQRAVKLLKTRLRARAKYADALYIRENSRPRKNGLRRH